MRSAGLFDILRTYTKLVLKARFLLTLCFLNVSVLTKEPYQCRNKIPVQDS